MFAGKQTLPTGAGTGAAPLKEAGGQECSTLNGPSAGKQHPTHRCPQGPALWVLPGQGEGLSGAAKNGSQQATVEGLVSTQGPRAPPREARPRPAQLPLGPAGPLWGDWRCPAIEGAALSPAPPLPGLLVHSLRQRLPEPQAAGLSRRQTDGLPKRPPRRQEVPGREPQGAAAGGPLNGGKAGTFSVPSLLAGKHLKP